MKKIKFILSLSIGIIAASSCSKEGIDDDLSFLNSVKPEDAAITLQVSDDNSGNVAVIPQGKGASFFLIDYGHDGTLSDTLSAGDAGVHAYPEGTYTVTAKSF